MNKVAHIFDGKVNHSAATSWAEKETEKLNTLTYQAVKERAGEFYWQTCKIAALQ